MGHVFFIVISSRPVSYFYSARIHMRQVRAPITPLALHAFRQSSVPALRSGVLDIGLRSRLSGPTIPTPPPGALGALGALSSNARARSLAARSLPLSPLPLDRRSLVEPSLSACGGFLSQASRLAAAAAAPILHFFRWVAKICLALLPLKTAPQRHAAPSQLV